MYHTEILCIILEYNVSYIIIIPKYNVSYRNIAYYIEIQQRVILSSVADDSSKLQ